MKLFWNCSLAALLAMCGPLANAQAKKGAAAPSNTANQSAPAQSPSSSAAFESQMLAFGALDHIAKEIAQKVCSNEDVKNNAQTIVIFDQASFASLQSYESFIANAQLVVGAYNTLKTESNKDTWYKRQQSLADQHFSSTPQAKNKLLESFRNYKEKSLSLAGPTFGDPISDAASLLSAIAVSSNTESAGSITIPDNALAVALTSRLHMSEGCRVKTIIYPPLFGSGSLTDASVAEIQVDIQKIDDVRTVAHQAVEDTNRAYIMEFPSKPATPPTPPTPVTPAAPVTPPTPVTPANSGTPATPGANDTILTTALTDIDGLYDNFMNALLQVNPSTGVTGSASVLQGRRLATLIAGKLNADEKHYEVPPAYILLASVVAAGGTMHVHKTLWTALSTGDKITYSGGAVVSFSLWNVNSKFPIYSDNLRYRSPLMNIKAPSDTSGVDSGDNLSSLVAVQK